MTQAQFHPPNSPSETCYLCAAGSPSLTSSLIQSETYARMVMEYPDPDADDSIVTDPDWDSADLGSIDGSEFAGSPFSISQISLNHSDTTDAGHPETIKQHIVAAACLAMAGISNAWNMLLTSILGSVNYVVKWLVAAAASGHSSATKFMSKTATAFIYWSFATGDLVRSSLVTIFGTIFCAVGFLARQLNVASIVVDVAFVNICDSVHRGTTFFARCTMDAITAAAFLTIYALFTLSNTLYNGAAWSARHIGSAGARPMTRSLVIGVSMGCLVLYGKESVTTTQTFRSIACRFPSPIAASDYDCPKAIANSSSSVISQNYIPLVNYQVATVERVLESVADNKKIALELTKNADATADLNQVLIHSSIPVRHELSRRIMEYVTWDRRLVISMDEFNSKVSGTAKALVAINGYTVRTAQNKYEASKSLYNRALSIVSGDGSGSQLTMQVYKELAETSRTHIANLVKHAYSLMELVNDQSAELDLIKGFLVVGKNEVTKDMNPNGLGGLWKIVASGKVDPVVYEKNLETLKHLSNAYKLARAHLSFITTTLRENALELQGADDQARFPLMVKDMDTADVGRHLQLLSATLDNLNAKRERAFQRIGMAEAMNRLLE